jgi:L-2-hydroxyglutarate oxidase LhgO
MGKIECVVVGAGVVGLAVARALALAEYEVLVLERAYAIGFETSSRNSEVIHGGLYYPNGSLKARRCVAGLRRLYAYRCMRGSAS